VWLGCSGRTRSGLLLSKKKQRRSLARACGGETHPLVSMECVGLRSVVAGSLSKQDCCGAGSTASLLAFLALHFLYLMIPL
jgi:hypothetical protein